jgi:hypothetical protein
MQYNNLNRTISPNSVWNTQTKKNIELLKTCKEELQINAQNKKN